VVSSSLTRLSRSGPIGFRAGVGSSRRAGSVLAGVVICRVVTYRFQSVRRSRSRWRPGSRFARSHAGSGGRLRRCLGSCGVIPSAAWKTAHARAWERASRPKPAKLLVNQRLREIVQRDLERRYSPEQIVGRLRLAFPDDPEMRVSPETIYQSLYVQSRGALRRDLTKCLRTGRALRRSRRQPHQRKNRIPDMINIAERPAQADDRAVPGHWEGDLILGKNNA